MPDARRRRDRALLGVLLLAFALFALGIHWGLPNTHPWNGDDISPEKPLRVLWTWLHGSHKYPYLHWWISLAAYAPWLLWLAARGQLDLGCLPALEERCFADPLPAFSVLMAISRGLSLLMALGTVALAAATARVLGGGRGAVLTAAAATACAPVLVFFAHTGNLDAPVTFWLALSLYFFARIVRRGTPLDHLAFGLAMGCALATKEAVVGAYVLPVLAILGLHLRRRLRGRPFSSSALARALLDVRMTSLAASALLVYGAANNVLFNWDGFVRHLAAWNPEGERMTGFRGGFSGWLPFAGRVLRTLGEGEGEGLLAVGALGVAVAAWRRRPALWLALPALSYLGFSLGAARFAPVRFALPLVPVLAVFVGEVVDAAGRRGRALRTLAAVVVGAALLHAGLRALNLDLFLVHDSRYLAEAWLGEHASPPARVAHFAPPAYLPRLARMGYDAWRVPEEEWTLGALDAGGAEWIVLSERFYPRFRGARGGFFEALLDGEHGWRIVWQGRGTTLLEPLLGGPGLVGAVNPTLTILGRQGATR